MGVATGCSFKDIYRSTYTYSSSICTFLQQHPYFFVNFLKCFSFFIYIFRAIRRTVNVLKVSMCI